MPEQFKLIREIFSERDQEQQWTYQILLEYSFNEKIITQITNKNRCNLTQTRRKVS